VNEETAAEIRDGMRRSVERRKVHQGLIDSIFEIVENCHPIEGLEGNGVADGDK